MKLTYLGHNCFLIDVNGVKLLVDPFIKANPINKTVDINTIECDYILLTHGHSDHCSDVVEIQKRTQAQLISNFEICSWFEEQGVKNYRPMNTGGKYVQDKFSVKMVTAVHSSTMPDGKSGGNANGFLVYHDRGAFYIAGDTALTLDMKLIKKHWGPMDFAILPIGDNFTMGAEDALIASDYCGCNQVVGAHYDTFGYIQINHNLAKEVFNRGGKTLHLLNIGESINL